LINYSSGQVTVFPKDFGPCYACRKGADRRRQLLQELQGREDPCWRKEEAIHAAEGVATTPLMASVVAAFQVELGLRALQDPADNNLGHAYLITLHPTPGLEPLVFERSPSCPLHDPTSVVTTVRECPEGRSDSWTPADLLQRSGNGDGYLAFDWPMTSKARCRSCGHEWEPFIRRARFRRQRCSACDSADLIEMEVLSGLRADSPWASRTLAELGLPLGHIHEIADHDPHAARVHVEMTGDFAVAGTAGRC
jgi:hypothetical protein